MDNLEIISLGSNCIPKYSINELKGNSQATYPFDWILTDDITNIINVINSQTYDYFIDFQKYAIDTIRFTNKYINQTEESILKCIDMIQLKQLIINYNTLESYDLLKELKNLINNAIFQINLSIDTEKIATSFFNNLVCIMTREETTLVHDHHINLHWDVIREKYHRRFKRFFDLSTINKKILFVRYSKLLEEDPTILCESLKNIYGANFVLLYMYNDDKSNYDLGQFEKRNECLYIYSGKLIFDKSPFMKNILKKFINEII